MERKKKVKLNTFIAALSRIIFLLIGFAARKLIINIVSIDYLGLNSLYSNLLDLLNFAELGLGVAVQIRLYEPLVNKDYGKIYNIIRFAKKLYTIIGAVVLTLGIGSSFFLPYIIKDNPFPNWYVQVAFIISVVGISLSYLAADKRLFFESNEEYFYITLSDLIMKVATFVAGITILYFTKNYLIYIGIIQAHLFLSNIVLLLIFRKKYAGYLKGQAYDAEFTKSESKAVRKNMKDVIPMKLGLFIFTSTDSIVISVIIGLTMVAIYSNYNLLFMSLLSLSGIVSTALVSTFGKMEKENPDNKEPLYKAFRMYSNIQFMFSSLTAVCIFLLIDKFIDIWLGGDYHLEFLAVLLFSIDYYIHSLFQPLSTLHTSTGKFKEDKICMIISAVINIVVSIVLAFLIGVVGVIIGTLVANLFTYVARSILIEHKFFGRKPIELIVRPIIQMAVVAAECVICYFAIKYISLSNKIVEFVVCGVICVSIIGLIDVIYAWKLGYLKYVKKGKKQNVEENS